MQVSMFDVMGAGRRGQARGFRGLGANKLPTCPTCPECPGTHPIWYLGTAVGAVTLSVLLLKAISK